MKTSYQWLQSYFEAQLPTPEEVARVLTFHAFEIEDVTKVADDTIIDVDVLPNRSSDCLSHRGIARELATLLSLPLTNDPLLRDVRAVPDSNVLDVSVETSGGLCRRFSGVVVHGVSVGPSPEWLVKRLRALGQKPINNIVDATNYVMFDVGQPLHAFDREKLTERDGGYTITVRGGRAGERLTLLSGEEKEVGEADVLITDGNSGTPLGIAGVKGGKGAEVDADTKHIIIEAANFDPVSIRKTSHALKLATDASLRFQNNPSPELTLYALSEVTRLIGGEVEGFVDYYPEKTNAKPVAVSPSDINAVLGTDMEEAGVTDILNRLGFAYEKEAETFVVTPPFPRTDIRLTEDLIEEVGRVYGYEHIDSQPLLPRSEKPAINKKLFYADKLRAFLVGEGFSEVYTHTLRERGGVELKNALAANRPFLRNTLADGLADALSLNAHNAPLLGLSVIRLFEIGTVFKKGAKEYTALALGARRGLGGDISRELEESAAKLAAHLGVSFEENFICTDGVYEANVDQLLTALPEPASYDAAAMEAGLATVKFSPISPYPFVLRDIALWVPENVTAEEVKHILREEGGELLAALRQFDEYKKDGRFSYAFRLVFQSHEKTLTDDEVGQSMKKVEAALAKQGFEIR